MSISSRKYTFDSVPVIEAIDDEAEPDGMDPIYAKNFLGKVSRIGDDGKNGTGSYLVRGSIVRVVKAATKAGVVFEGDLSDRKRVLLIPTGQIMLDVQETATATINSGDSPETRIEYGGHVLIGDEKARIWDAGTPMETTTTEDESENKWSIKPFRIGGKDNQVGGPGNDIIIIWHIHPNDSTPSKDDKKHISHLRKNGFNGYSFLIDVNNGRVAYYNKNRVLIKINYDTFKQMGNQERL